eukprot:767294-Hanusia_phi.AAC.3
MQRGLDQRLVAATEPVLPDQPEYTVYDTSSTETDSVRLSGNGRAENGPGTVPQRCVPVRDARRPQHVRVSESSVTGFKARVMPVLRMNGNKSRYLTERVTSPGGAADI